MQRREAPQEGRSGWNLGGEFARQAIRTPGRRSSPHHVFGGRIVAKIKKKAAKKATKKKATKKKVAKKKKATKKKK
jgi:hypothetical protein